MNPGGGRFAGSAGAANRLPGARHSRSVGCAHDPSGNGGRQKAAYASPTLTIMSDDTRTLNAIITRYERFAQEWTHPSLAMRLYDHERGAPVIERWHTFLDSIAERFETTTHQEHLDALITTLNRDTSAYQRAERVVGAYLWELARRGDERIIAPDVLALFKPERRAYLEPLFAMSG